MAKLPALVSALAEVDGRERKTVDHVARTIRERGYIPTTKRGGGAAEMSVREAVNLILALSGSEAPKEAPLAVDRFRSLRQWFGGTSAEFKARVASYDTSVKPVQDVMDAHTLGQALEALVEGAPDLAAALTEIARDSYPHLDPRGLIQNHAVGLDVTLRRYAASIEIYTSRWLNPRVVFRADFKRDDDLDEQGYYGERRNHDRRVVVTIGAPTIFAAWLALNPGKSLPCFSLAAADSAETTEA